MKRRLLVVVLLLATAAAQTVQETPPPERGTGLEESNCFQCHEEGGGRFGPSLAQMFSLDLQAPQNVSLNEPVRVQATVENQWLAELMDLQLTFDVRGAPSLSLEPRPEPILDRRDWTTLPAQEVTEYDEERQGEVRFVLPANATEARVVFRANTTQGPEAPSPSLRLRDPTGSRFDLPTPGPGEPVRLRWQGDHVPGEHRIEITMPSVFSGLPELNESRMAPQSFHVVADAWFNVTSDERIVVRTTPDTLDGLQPGTDQTWTTSFTVFLVEPMPSPIDVTANLTAFFEHPRNAAEYDEWPFTAATRIMIGPNAPPPNATAGATPKPERADLAPAAEAVGYWTAFLVLSSVTTGGILGRRSRRTLNRWFGSARRRVAFHSVTSYAILLGATIHAILFLVEAVYHWSIGLLWGGLATLALYSLGISGALQVLIVRRWSHRAWLRWHLASAWIVLLATTAHLLLDGVHFAPVAEALDWRDPLAEALGAPVG